MNITPKMIERAAKTLRRMEYPASVDPRPWRKVLTNRREYYLRKAEKVLRAALTPDKDGQL